MRMIGLALAGVLLAARAEGQPVGAPRISINDSWTYQETIENGAGWHQTRTQSTVLRVGPTSITLSSSQIGSVTPPHEQLRGVDWSRSRSVNGLETVVYQPLSFPLSIGKTWEVEFTEDNPNRKYSSVQMRTAYRAVGWEDVTVPAGRFRALKIEADMAWSGVIALSVAGAAGSIAPTTDSGRSYAAIWYVPEVKKWVKTVEISYDANGVRSGQRAQELESYKVSG
jgi:hypothetical protein